MQWHNIYNFWFGEYKETKEYLAARMPFWFVGKVEVDQDIAARFGALLELYEHGDFPWSYWKATPRAFLCLIILFDQFPRNIFRGSARSYQYDALGLSLAREFMARGWYNKLEVFEKIFILMPFEHSESLAVQRECVAEFQRLQTYESPENKYFLAMAIDFAEKHKYVIEQFGRYPHRNAVLGRKSTSAEQQFLDSAAIRF